MTHDFLLQNSWLIALAAGSGLMLFWPSLTKTGAQRLSVAQATTLMNQKKAVLLDVRHEQDVIKRGEVPQAKRFPDTKQTDLLASLVKSKETPVVVLAEQGGRVGRAVQVLKTVGYTQIFVLDGGFEAWQEAGMPIRKSKSS